jgi:putative FmdB family regulatory protein
MTVPIYEYLCESCRHQFEVKQKFSDDPISACVRCGQAVKKLISAPAIMFKGSGWYVTDYSDKLKAPEGSTSTDPAAKPSASGSEHKTQAPTPGNDSAASSPSSTATPASGGSGDSSQKSSSAPTPTPTPTTSTSSST